MSSPKSADVPIITVQHHLRRALSALDLLKRIACAVDEPRKNPLFDPPEVARLTWQLVRITEVHLNAALSPQVPSVDAPIGVGGWESPTS